MKLYLQFGFNMRPTTMELLQNGCGAGVVLSPRDQNDKQLIKTAAEINDFGADLLFDPQCFAHDSDHTKLTAHGYFSEFKSTTTSNIISSAGAAKILKKLFALNVALETKRIILPGTLADPVSDPWFAFQEKIVQEALKIFTGYELFATVALSNTVMLDEAQIEAVVERAAKWQVNGFYVVVQSTSYLSESPVWLANLLILTSGLKLLRKEIIVGYCSHQMLSLACANVDAIASGTWLNVRAFDPAKFYIPPENDDKRRATWYYCPQALSEFKLPFLDLARTMGKLNAMVPQPDSNFANALFAGPAPTTIAWKERNAFLHYLSCLDKQAKATIQTTFDSAVAAHQAALDQAEKVLDGLHKIGVTGQVRDFEPIFAVNRGALIAFSNARATQLRHNW